ncbi:MAG: DUF3788 family protein [Flavobacterium sp.]|uniref:DUF3788 family protein n=1 Tax=Flavobacterium sp. TaxID=239 RepID=UPI00391B72CF
MKSIFTHKTEVPTEAQLQEALGITYSLWQALASHTISLYPDATTQWHYSGEKFGWSYRISDKKRVLIYLLPRDQFFKVAFVFGQKATDTVLKSNIADTIKNELLVAKPYAEGRGIRLSVTDETMLNDIKQLTTIKISN